MNLDWSQVQIFLTLAEAGSLSRAAPLLGQSQPTVGRQLEALESSLGQVLFERSSRGLRLTEAGQALLPAARRMREGAQELALAVAAREQSLAGTVRLTASEVVSIYFLPSVLADLRQRHPEVQIELVVSNEQEDLQQRRADIALRMVRPAQEMLVARKLCEWPVGVFAHSDYIARRGQPQMSSLLAHDWLGYDRSDLILRGFEAAGTPVQASFFGLRCDNQVMVWEAMRAGIGLAVGPLVLGERDPALQRVLPELPIAPLEMWLTAHSELRDTPRLRLLFDTLAAAFESPYRA